MVDEVAIDELWPGRPHPRGATWDGHGVNFALFSVFLTAGFISRYVLIALAAAGVVGRIL